MPEGSTADPLAVRVSASVIARAVGVSTRRVTQLRDEGRIPGVEGGKFILGDATSAYCSTIRSSAGKAAAGGSDGGDTLDTARVRLVLAQADAREMLNAQLRGDAVLSEDLDVIVGGTFDAVRQKLLAVPVSAAARVLGLTSKIEIQKAITKLVNDALADLATIEVVGTVKDRARRRAGRGLINDGGDGEKDE